MAINRTFSVRHGLDVANTIVLDSERNLSNVNVANVHTINANTYLTVAGLNVVDHINSAFSTANSKVESINVSGNGLSVSNSTTSNLNQYTLSVNSATTIERGTTLLIDSISSSDIANAATANAVKTAWDYANTKLSLSGGTINGSLNVSGNLTITGQTKYINVETYSVTDPLIYLAANNETSDLVDIGFMGGHNTSGVYQHSGLVRDAGDGTWYLFTGLLDEGHENNVVDFANTTLATLRSNIAANSITLVGNTVATQANLTLAHDQANNAYDQANSNYQPAVTRLNVTNSGSTSYLFDQYSGDNPTLYVRAGETLAFSLSVTGHPFLIRTSSGGARYNTGLTHVSTAGVVTTEGDAQAKVAGTLYWKVPYELQGNTYVYQCSIHGGMVGNIVIEPPMVVAYAQANTAYDQANDAYTAANTANTNALAAYGQANAAFDQANTAYGQANDAYSAANTANTNALAAYGQANAAFDQANSAFSQANLAYDQANTAYGQANDAYSAANTANTNALAAYGQANAAFDQANTAYGQANDAYAAANSAANTVRVSQNSGSTLSAKQLNFVNTANVTITVTDSGDGNANVEIFSAAGGGGGSDPAAANTVMVSANSGSTLAQKRLNFINTASVFVSVSDSGDGNANISFTSLGGAGAANIAILDEGSSVVSAVTSLDFVGTGVSASAVGTAVTINIPGTLNPLTSEIISDKFTGNGAQTVYTLSQNADAETVFVFLNGVAQKPNTDYQVSNNVLTLNTAPSVNTVVEVRSIGQISVIRGSTIESDIFSANGAANTFTLAKSSNTIETLVYIDGVSQRPEVDYQVSGNTLTFNVAPLNGTVVEARSFIRVPVITPTEIISTRFNGDGSCTSFVLANSVYTTNSLFVFVDGVTQVPNVDYDISGSTLSFGAPPEANAVIEVRSLNGIQVGYYGNSSNIIYETTKLEIANSEVNFTTGGFTVETDSISRTYLLRGTTTNNVESEIFLTGNTRIPVSTNTTIFYTAEIVGRRTDAADESAGYQLKGVVDNFSGTVADVGSLYELVVAEDDAVWTVDARADDTNNSINIYVTGEDSKTIRWTALVKTVEVAQ